MQRHQHSELIAKILSHSWRTVCEPADIHPDELDSIAKVLLETGAGGLGWRRVRGSNLAEGAAAHALHQASRLNALHTARAETETAEAVSLLAQNSIETVLVKGVALTLLYPEAGARPAGDIDLCVAASDYRRADTLLKNHGLVVDLHEEFSTLDNRAWQDLYDRTVTISIKGQQVRIPSPEDHLRILCFHFLREGAWRPLWLCDIAAAIERWIATLNWNLFLDDDPRRAKWFACVIVLAHELLGASTDQVPRNIIEARVPSWLRSAVLKAWEVRTMQRRHLTPMRNAIRDPVNTIKGLRHHWPNPIEGTVVAGAPFNEMPRLPFQLATCLARTVTGTGSLLARSRKNY